MGQILCEVPLSILHPHGLLVCGWDSCIWSVEIPADWTKEKLVQLKCAGHHINAVSKDHWACKRLEPTWPLSMWFWSVFNIDFSTEKWKMHYTISTCNEFFFFFNGIPARITQMGKAALWKFWLTIRRQSATSKNGQQSKYTAFDLSLQMMSLPTIEIHSGLVSF